MTEVRKKGYIEVVNGLTAAKKQQAFLRIVAANGNIICSTQYYATRSNALRAGRWLASATGFAVRDEVGKVLVEAEVDWSVGVTMKADK